MIKLLSLLGALGVSATAPTIIVSEKLTNIENYKETIFEYGEGPYGITEDEVLETTLIENFIKELEIFLDRNNQSLENIINARIRLTSTAESTGNNNNIIKMLKDILQNDAKIISETYQAKHVESGNYSVDYNLIYELPNGEQVTVKLNTYTTLFNQYQLENGQWSLILDFEYVEKDINETETQFISDIVLPDYGFLYYAHQVEEMFNNYEPFNKTVIDLISKQKDVKLKDIHAIDLAEAIQDGDSFIMGQKYNSFDQIEDKYFYVSFESESISGTYNMIIKNVDLK